MRVPVALMALVVLAGCAKQPAPPAAKVAAPAPATPAAAAASTASGVAPVPAPPNVVTVSGTVLETMDASEYTYMRLKTASGEIWTAINKAKIRKGDAVTVTNAMVMDGFQSKTLNRTFDHILFGVLAGPGGAPPAAAAAPPAAAPGAAAPAAAAPMIADHRPSNGSAPATQPEMAAQHGEAIGGPPDAPDVKVPKADGPNAKTVAEVWTQRVSLKGKEVVVKGKVVKVTNGVMGKNWLHLRDGSGAKAKKDNDLSVTTGAVVKVGDVVTATGLVTIDKDFGAGYAYPVILENAKVK
jgi:hypothetical protein